MATSSIDIFNADFRILFHVNDTSTGAVVTTGTNALRIYHIQTDGTLEQFDFNDGTFKTSSLTTETLALTHQSVNSNNTGVWTVNVPVTSNIKVNGFEDGGLYLFQATPSASNTVLQSRLMRLDLSGPDVNTINTTPGVNIVEIDGDDTPATNLAADYDGTGYNKSSSTIGTVEAVGVTGQASINGQVDTALSDIGLDHLLSSPVVGTDVADNSLFAKLVSKGATANWDDFANTTDSFEAISDQLGTGSGLANLADTATVNLSATGLDAITFNVDGASMTAKAALQLIAREALADVSISGTTLTISDADGTIATFTLNDGTNPTSRTKD